MSIDERSLRLGEWSSFEGQLFGVCVLELSSWCGDRSVAKCLRRMADEFGKVFAEYGLRPFRAVHEEKPLRYSFVFKSNSLGSLAEMMDTSLIYPARWAPIFRTAAQDADSPLCCVEIHDRIELDGAKWLDDKSPANTRRSDVQEWPYFSADDIGQSLQGVIDRALSAGDIVRGITWREREQDKRAVENTRARKAEAEEQRKRQEAARQARAEERKNTVVMGP